MAFPGDADAEVEREGALPARRERSLRDLPVGVVVAVALFFAAWQGLVAVARVPALLLPPPGAVWTALWTNAGAMAPHVTYTGMEVALGWAVGAAAGASLASAMAVSRWLRAVLYPYALAVRVVPLVAIAPLLVLAFGPTLLTRVLLASLLTFFPVTVATLEGLRSVPEQHVSLARTVDASRWAILTRIRLPHALPEAFAGLKLAAPLAVEGVIIAEFLASTRGVGFRLMETARTLRTPLLFAYLAVLVAFGLAVFGAVALAERRLRWDDGGSTLGERLGAERAVTERSRSVGVAAVAAAAVGLFVLWNVAAAVVPHAAVFLPRPAAVAASLAASPGVFVGAASDTLAKLLVGWSVGAAVGLVLGAATALVPGLRSTLYPFVVGVRVMPQIAIAPVLLVWFGISFESAVVMVAASSFFPVTVGTATGLAAVPESHAALLRSVDAPAWKALVFVRFRHAVPALFAGLKLAVVAALSGTVVAEWFVAERGLGVLVLQGMTDFAPALTYAATACLFALGAALFAVAAVAQRFVSW